mmetsp:Transcript_18432/g.29967  ORF Transcript_18432/g.29967 Transcript_18432/m.29967 type:complete len:301 (+) Transcript_18432:1403-2305(+)
MPQFDGDKDHLVEREEDRDLEQDRQTARSRVHLFLLIELHHPLLHFLPVVARGFLELFHLGLKLFHLGHRDIGFIGQWEQDRLDHQRQPNDRPAHIANDQIHFVQQPKDWLGQEEEPTPVDRVDKAFNACALIGADRVPFLCASEKLRRNGCRRARRDLAGRQHGFGLVDVPPLVIFDHLAEGRAGRGDQRAHPIVVGKTDPAVLLDRDGFSARALARVDFVIGNIGPVYFAQLAVGHGHDTLMQDEEVFEVLWFSMSGDQPIRCHADIRGAVVCHRLSDRKHILIVDRDVARERLARVV